MEDCNGALTPCATSLPNVPNQSEVNKNLPYDALVGSLLWLSLGTRGDICYSVHILSKYTKCYNMELWNYGKRILRFLKQTMNDTLIFNAKPGTDGNATEFRLIGYCDSSFADDKQDRHSTFGYCIFYNGMNCVSWSSKKTDTVVLSTCEAEYFAITRLTQELTFFKQLINELFANSIHGFMIYCDNKAAINLATKSTDHGRSKHIDIRLFFIRELVKSKKVLQLEYIKSEDQISDIFTKGLNKEILIKHKSQLNIL